MDLPPDKIPEGFVFQQHPLGIKNSRLGLSRFLPGLLTKVPELTKGLLPGRLEAEQLRLRIFPGPEGQPLLSPGVNPHFSYGDPR